MINKLDELFKFHQQALQVREHRQQVLASNIANADTPNYKARDVDFNAALQGALARDAQTAQSPAASTLATTAPNHMTGASTADVGPGGAPLLYRKPSQGSVDGNTVDVDTERAQFADNALRYEASLTMLNHQIKAMLAAIQG